MARILLIAYDYKYILYFVRYNYNSTAINRAQSEKIFDLATKTENEPSPPSAMTGKRCFSAIPADATNKSLCRNLYGSFSGGGV